MSNAPSDHLADYLDIPPDESAIIVFLVDDQAMIGEAVRRAIASESDMVFHYCANASEAVDMALRISPTVILQDLVMPDMDGLTLVGLYRANAALREIPIIVLSSKEDAAVKSEAFAADVSDYLVKLPDKIELIARIRHHSKSYLNRRQRDAAYRALSESQDKLIRMNEVLQRLSHVDGLTGLSNRRYLDDFLDTEWLRAARELTEFSVLMIDVDNFKKYNDTHGHLAGDEVLKQVAFTLRACLNRPVDLAARFGGEEFVIVLPGTGLAGAKVMGEHICRAVENLNVTHGGMGENARITVSVGGGSTWPVRDWLPNILLGVADEALYAAKAAGKNCALVRELATPAGSGAHA